MHTKVQQDHTKCKYANADKVKQAEARAHKVAGGPFGEGGAARLNGQHPQLPFALIFDSTLLHTNCHCTEPKKYPRNTDALLSISRQ